MSVSITSQERALLELIARGEAVSNADPYTSLWPGTSEQSLTQMTLAEVDRFQTQRLNKGFKSSAAGKYQFIRGTLRECVRYIGANPLLTRFTPDIQDALITARLKKVRNLDSWLGGSLPTDKFMIKLSQEFASMPVPYAIQGHRRPVSKGQSYYSGDGLNSSNHSPDALYQELEDIKSGTIGSTSVIPVNNSGPSGAFPSGGSSPKTQAETAAAGLGVGAYTGGNAGSQPAINNTLPVAHSVYQYKKIHPLDNRYDFRTGDKVKDILIRSNSAPSDTPAINGNIGLANVTTSNSGSIPLSGDANNASDEFSINTALTGGVSAIAGGGPKDVYDDAILRQARINSPLAEVNTAATPIVPITSTPSGSANISTTSTAGNQFNSKQFPRNI